MATKHQHDTPSKSEPQQKPNILLIMVDQFRYPRFGYESEQGFRDPLQRIFGFQGDPDELNEYKQYFPGLWALRDNAVVLNNHRTASSACVPSRTAMFSGQYGTVTGSLYTDGCLKEGTDPVYPWLDPEVFPTLGDWMREVGYTTHYFGKWHVSGETTPDLEGYGFGDWDQSYPDPYGSSVNNLGYYRDYQFSALTRTFLLSQGLGVPYNVSQATKHANEVLGDSDDDSGDSDAPTATPWFAVCSFNNPHDIGLYSNLPQKVSETLIDGKPYILAVPGEKQLAPAPVTGTMQIELNKHGFPQENAGLPPTWNEELRLANKPSSHFEGTYKVGVALMCNGGQAAIGAAQMAGLEITEDELLQIGASATLNADTWGMPLVLTSTPEEASLRYLQYYGYLMSEVDQHIQAVLATLEETGQADNTIVIFTADHGENGAAHQMMMEKFHAAYEESIHVPMVVRFPRGMVEVEDVMKQVNEVTSHIDLLPTVLGFAGVDADARELLQRELLKTHPGTRAPVGTDISAFIKAKAEGGDTGASATLIDQQTNAERRGVLFMTHDTITQPLAGDPNEPEEGSLFTNTDVYNAAVDELIRRAQEGEAGTPEEARKLVPGPVRDPSLLNCVVSQDGWKLVRYFTSMDAIEEGNEYELYDLERDPNEVDNLLVYNAEFPTVIPELPAEQTLAREAIVAKAREMMTLLRQLEEDMLQDPRSTKERSKPARLRRPV